MDTLLFTASCTKLMTSIAAMQCVESGQASLDMDVGENLPELAKAEILIEFKDAGEPVMKKRQNTITLRYLTTFPSFRITSCADTSNSHLLTHSAGLAYDAFSPLLMRYRKDRNEEIGAGSTVPSFAGSSLLYEPGTKWLYSTSMDWAGKLVERTTGVTLEEYISKSEQCFAGQLHLLAHFLWLVNPAHRLSRPGSLQVML